MKYKTAEEIEDCVDFQLQKLKKEYVEKYGIKECEKRDASFLQGCINSLAWVKVFAIQDLKYNPKKRKFQKVN